MQDFYEILFFYNNSLRGKSLINLENAKFIRR